MLYNFLSILLLIIKVIYLPLLLTLSIYKYFFPTLKSLIDDVVLITGAGNGIGRELCLELSGRCKTLIGLDINEESLLKTFELVKQKALINMKIYVCDVSDRESVAKCAANIKVQVGKVTVVVNNAGILNGKYMMALTPSEFENTIKVNLFSSFYMVQAFIGDMLGNKYYNALHRIPIACRSDAVSTENFAYISSSQEPRGHLVFITSFAALHASPGLADYCASKAALSNFASVIRMEFAELGFENDIHITEVRPFHINTEMFKGCHSKIPFIFPILDKKLVAKRIVYGICCNEAVIDIPKYMMFFVIFHLLPKSLLHRLYRLVGGNVYITGLQRHSAKKD